MSHSDKNIEVFRDTVRLCETHERLKASVLKSTLSQKLIREADVIPVPTICPNDSPPRIVVSEKRTFEAARAYRGMRTAVLNFANPWEPGGGVERGADAQEECLCRCSGLSICLKAMEDKFYLPHKKAFSPLANDDLIYTPDILVFKTDAWIPRLMPESEWYTVDVITCAAPVLAKGFFKGSLSNEELLGIHERRLGRILDAAIAEHVESIVLGAFGCGAFCNDPNVVASAFKHVLARCGHAFKNIEFAIYSSDYEMKNYEIFRSVLGSLPQHITAIN